MKGKERLTKTEQFSLVYNEGSTLVDRLLVLKARPNQLEFSRYGISVSKRVGKANVRNRVKRVLREVLRLTPMVPGWDIILIARTPSAVSRYQEMNRAVTGLLYRARITVR
jgi:ribonuclease P protein component